MASQDPNVTSPRDGRADVAGDDRPGVDGDRFDGGDAVCWLSRVCDECGALVEGVGATPCWRCGAVLVRD
ncbi:hypothetical protein [Agromyces sp. Marseille-Q5079]|uniref:hypothetical protein n=1 Tax=Agromyces sp. Marseille-Q5079 TaxID=3439059 RepID=UPI003D9CA519